MAERVDKQWQKKGLAGYSTEAIVGTLAHYGVIVDQRRFETLSRHDYPIKIAQAWTAEWKGTGQFSPFPLAAADELWKRWQPARLAPSTLHIALWELIDAFEQLLKDNQSAPVGAALAQVSEQLKQVPVEGDRPNAHFMLELKARLGEATQALEQLPSLLAKEGHHEDADELATITGFLFPERTQLISALLLAEKGQKTEAIAELSLLLQQPSDDSPALLDALLQLEAFEVAESRATQLFDQADVDGNFHLALEVGERLAFILESTKNHDALSKLNARLQKVHAAHAQAHPHH